MGCCGRLRFDDPVLFLEHKRLYREPYNRSPHPGADYTIPFGRAHVVKPGLNLTVVNNGALVFNRTVTLRDTWARIERGQKGR